MSWLLLMGLPRQRDILACSSTWRICSAARSIWSRKMRCARSCGQQSRARRCMSDANNASPPREWRFYLDDMIGFAERVLSYTDGLDQKSFDASRLNYDATLRNLELIGEAATHIPAPYARAHRKCRGVRSSPRVTASSTATWASTAIRCGASFRPTCQICCGNSQTLKRACRRRRSESPASGVRAESVETGRYSAARDWPRSFAYRLHLPRRQRTIVHFSSRLDEAVTQHPNPLHLHLDHIARF